MAPRSLRRALLLTLFAALTGGLVAAALLVYRVALRETDTLFDYHLRQIALSLQDHARWQGASNGGDARKGFDFVVQIWGPDGTRLYQSRPHVGVPEVSELGFVTARARTGLWRVYSTMEGGQRIQVTQPLRTRQALAFSAAVRTISPVLLLLPVLLVLVWRLVGHALAPLERLAGEVSSRTATALGPFSEADAAEETLPLVRSLNTLVARLGSALASQRAFIADAAHALRTPLAALKLQVSLVDQAVDAEERSAARASLHAGLDRVAHLVEQLLTLAREQPEAAGAKGTARVDLGEVVGQVVADHVVIAEAKGLDLGAAEGSGEPVVSGDPAALRILLANLVDNAIRYTPRGGRIDVSTSTATGRVVLDVSDTGPGVPAEDRERVFDRFYRRAGSAGSGSGLGLAIVKTIADRHGGTVTLHDAPGGGLTVRVELPSALAAPSREEPTAPHLDAGPALGDLRLDGG